jgi:hypothetical protein
MMQVGMFAIALHAGDIQGISAEYERLLRLFSLLVTGFVVWFSARGFFESAWRHLRQGALVMDLPVALAIGLAFGASTIATFFGAGDVYFDSVVMFTFLLLLARFIEKRMRYRDALAWQDAEQTLPDAAQVWRNDGALGTTCRARPRSAGTAGTAAAPATSFRSTACSVARAPCARTASAAKPCRAGRRRRHGLRRHAQPGCDARDRSPPAATPNHASPRCSAPSTAPASTNPPSPALPTASPRASSPPCPARHGGHRPRLAAARCRSRPLGCPVRAGDQLPLRPVPGDARQPRQRRGAAAPQRRDRVR